MNKMILVVFLFIFLISGSMIAVAAPFDRTSGLIDIPTADTLGYMILELGYSTSYNGVRLEEKYNEDDGKLNFGLLDNLEIGWTGYTAMWAVYSTGKNVNTYGIHIHYRLSEEQELVPAFALGVQNIVLAGKRDADTAGNPDIGKTAYSFYAVASKSILDKDKYRIRGHLGVGNSRFAQPGAAIGIFGGVDATYSLAKRFSRDTLKRIVKDFGDKPWSVDTIEEVVKERTKVSLQIDQIYSIQMAKDPIEMLDLFLNDRLSALTLMADYDGRDINGGVQYAYDFFKADVAIDTETEKFGAGAEDFNLSFALSFNTLPSRHNIVIKEIEEESFDQVAIEVSKMTGWDLAETKERLDPDKLPTTILRRKPREQARQIKTLLEGMGAKVDLGYYLQFALPF